MQAIALYRKGASYLVAVLFSYNLKEAVLRTRDLEKLV